MIVKNRGDQIVLLVFSSHLQRVGPACLLLRASNDIHAPSKLARLSLGMGAD